MARCVLLAVLFIQALTLANSHTHGPRETLAAEGVDLHNLPEGGWTGWFSSDGPSGKGDIETVDHIVKRYGRSCSRGLPCKAGSVAVVQARTHSSSMRKERQKPEDTGDVYHLDINGLTCWNHDQDSGNKCHDYEVRFFCTGCDTKFCCMPDLYDQIKRLLNIDQ